MSRTRVILALGITLMIRGASMAAPIPAEEQVETTRSSTLRAVYFPFLAVGHGVLLVAEYGVAYPVYYLFKPVYEFAYTSSEDPAELAGRHEHHH